MHNILRQKYITYHHVYGFHIFLCGRCEISDESWRLAVDILLTREPDGMIQCYQPEEGGMCKLLDGNLCLGQFEEGRRALLIGHEGIGGRFGGDVEYKVVLYQSFTSSPRYLTTHFLGKISPVFTWPNQRVWEHTAFTIKLKTPSLNLKLGPW